MLGGLVGDRDRGAAASPRRHGGRSMPSGLLNSLTNRQILWFLPRSGCSKSLARWSAVQRYCCSTSHSPALIQLKFRNSSTYCTRSTPRANDRVGGPRCWYRRQNRRSPGGHRQRGADRRRRIPPTCTVSRAWSKLIWAPSRIMLTIEHLDAGYRHVRVLYDITVSIGDWRDGRRTRTERRGQDHTAARDCWKLHRACRPSWNLTE